MCLIFGGSGTQRVKLVRGLIWVKFPLQDRLGSPLVGVPNYAPVSAKEVFTHDRAGGFQRQEGGRLML